MNTPSRSLLAVSGVLAAVFASAFAADPKVEETIVGPANQGGLYVVSPTGGRIAYMGLKGTRLVVTVDGVEGPVFDELYTSMGGGFYCPQQATVIESTPGWPTPNSLVPIVFSLEGGHYAYAARQGNEYVVIHDGNEIARGPREMLSLNYGWLKISPKGKIVYFMEMMRPASGNAKWRMVVNGKPGPWSSNNHGMELVFSPDETRYAFNAASENSTNEQVLVVDGKVANYLGIKPVFTADGEKLLSIAQASVSNPKTAVLVDGKPAISPLSVDKIIPSPVGGSWGAVVRTKMEGSRQVSAFFLDGKEVPGTDGAQNAWFSDDGKHYAVACENSAARSMFMVVDGKKQNEYQGLSVDGKLFRWTPDGTKFIYNVTAGGRPFVVVNDEEFPVDYLVSTDPFAMAQTGNRYGYATRDGSNRNFRVMIDGQSVLPAGYTPVDQTLTFSPDGSTYAYFVGNVGRNGLAGIIINGEIQQGLTPTYFSKWQTMKDTVSAITFSPDSKHIAYMASSDPQQGFGLHVDGTMVYPTRKPLYFPTFTPDSKHLCWVALVDPPSRGQQPPAAVFVDGREAVRTNTFNFQHVSGSFVMDENGVMTFFGSDGDHVKRYRITPQDDTSVATLIENGTVPVVASSPAPVTATAVATATAVKTPVATVAPAATGEDLTWAILARRPELWPTACVLNRDVRFQDGTTVRTGTNVSVVELAGNTITVSSSGGAYTFEVGAGDTNALEVARATWVQLSPEQKNLNYATLLQRPDLWPYRVKATVGFEVGGRTIRPGDPLLLQSVDRGQLLVRIEGTDIAVNLQPQETDLITQARAFLAEGGAPGRVLEEFSGKLINPVTGSAAAIDAGARPKYVIMYMGAAWCGPCQQFSPGLVKLLKDKAPSPDDAMVIYLSGDKTPAEMKGYVTKLGVAWPTIRYNNSGQLPAFSQLFGQYIPQLVVTDRHGKVVIDSSKVGTAKALQQLAGLL